MTLLEEEEAIVWRLAISTTTFVLAVLWFALVQTPRQTVVAKDGDKKIEGRRGRLHEVIERKNAASEGGHPSRRVAPRALPCRMFAAQHHLRRRRGGE